MVFTRTSDNFCVKIFGVSQKFRDFQKALEKKSQKKMSALLTSLFGSRVVKGHF